MIHLPDLVHAVDHSHRNGDAMRITRSIAAGVKNFFNAAKSALQHVNAAKISRVKFSVTNLAR
jgi:hypothetical protein